MTWRNELTAVDWACLEHAYGTADDLPSLLEALTGPEHADAASELWAAVLHQGSVFDATPPAMTVVAAMIADGAASDPDFAGWLLLVFDEAVDALADPLPSELQQDDPLLAACRAAQLRIADLLLPLLDGDGPLAVAVSQQARSTPDPAVVEALLARVGRVPADELAWACAATLAHLGVGLPRTDPALEVAAAVARIRQDRATDADIAMIADRWSLAVEIGTILAASADPFVEWLTEVNPAAAAGVQAALPTIDPASVDVLVDQAVRSPPDAMAATARLVQGAIAPSADPATFIEALRQVPPHAAVLDALVTSAHRVTASRPQVMRGPRETDPRADAGWALLRANDPRWSRLLWVVLATNPAAAELWVATLGGEYALLGEAFINAPMPTEVHLGVQQVLRAPSDSPGARALSAWQALQSSSPPADPGAALS